MGAGRTASAAVAESAAVADAPSSETTPATRQKECEGATEADPAVAAAGVAVGEGGRTSGSWTGAAATRWYRVEEGSSFAAVHLEGSDRRT